MGNQNPKNKVETNPGADFPFEPNFVEVHGSKMHYVDVGESPEGEAIVCLHGNPTSSYLWRNVIPHLQTRGRVIAPDLIGMGRSDKPDIGYRIEDHAHYLQGFMDALNLQKITLVIHDWGSALGFDFAAKNPSRVHGIAFMEAVTQVPKWSELPKAHRSMFGTFRNPILGRLLIQGLNFFSATVVPKSVLRAMSDEEKSAYTAPFPNWKSRKPTYVFPNEIPFDGKPADVAERIDHYASWLASDASPPKLLLWCKPGAITPKREVERLESAWSNLKSVYVGSGLHFIQEDQPTAIGTEIVRWMDEQGLASSV